MIEYDDVHDLLCKFYFVDSISFIFFQKVNAIFLPFLSLNFELIHN
jgi:hypothetical protein